MNGLRSLSIHRQGFQSVPIMIRQRLLLRPAPSLDLHLGFQRGLAVGKILAEDQGNWPACMGVTARNLARLMLRDPIFEVVRMAGVERTIRALEDVDPEAHDVRTPGRRSWFDPSTDSGSLRERPWFDPSTGSGSLRERPWFDPSTGSGSPREKPWFDPSTGSGSPREKPWFDKLTTNGFVLVVLAER
ncbi:MAG TPA: hypothetical protein VK753_06290 [Xanthomonadaceae bacterium]|nr:hypothetical protein [Xanthomonadaceae bacterium]